MRFGLLIAVLGLCACTQTNNFHEFEQSARLHSQVVPAVIEPPEILEAGFIREQFANTIFELNEAQQNDFLTYYNHAQNRNTAPHIRVANYLQDSTANFTYQGNTYNAAEAFVQQAGNCLSLAVLSTALVELTGLKYAYKKVHSAPIFGEQGNVQFVSSHINLTVFDDHSMKQEVLMPASVVIDYFREGRSVNGSSVTKEDVLIMFWHNLAAEAIAEANLNDAFSFTMMANDIDPLHPETLNLLAILYSRKGYVNKAIEVYDFLDKHQIMSYTSVDNFAAILKKKGEVVKANELYARVENINEDNPYTWLYAAKDQVSLRNYVLAERYFQKSLALAPYLHEIHFNLAMVYAKTSNVEAAKSALTSAMVLASVPEEQRRYQAKLFGLKGYNE